MVKQIYSMKFIVTAMRKKNQFCICICSFRETEVFYSLSIICVFEVH